ncbi:MAG: hypothetical protein HY042_02610 [Spirochaetia bacterium]|nr:hypothetical protein [Spirochaetia bacterium]
MKTAARATVLALLSLWSGVAAGDSRDAEQVIQADRLFSFYKCPFTWTSPIPVKVRISPRGVFNVCEITPVSGDAFVAQLSAFQIRRPGKIIDLADRINCGKMTIPPGEEFDTEASCAGNTGGNEITRRVRLVRKGDLIFLFYIACRNDQKPAADSLLQSVRLNTSFYVPKPP